MAALQASPQLSVLAYLPSAPDAPRRPLPGPVMQTSSAIESALAFHTATLADSGTSWDARASALRDIATVADDSETSQAAAAALTAALPSLAPQLAAAISELRSAVVRDACAAVTALSHGLGPAFAAVAAEQLTPVLLRASRVTIAVVAASAASAAHAMFTCCATGVPPRVTGLLARAVVSRGEKSHPAARAAAAEYLGILLHGGVMEMLPERVADEVQEAVAAGCVDSAVQVRDISRGNWRLLREADPYRASEVLAKIPANMHALLSGGDNRSGAQVGGSAMMPTPLSKAGPRSRAGGPRRVPLRPSTRAESDASTSPPVAVRPPKPPPRKPPVVPKRVEASMRRELPSVKPVIPFPFARRPARRSVAVGVTGPLLRPEQLQSPAKSSGPVKNGAAAVSAGSAFTDSSSSAFDHSNSPLPADEAKPATTSLPALITSSRSSTELSRRESSPTGESPRDAKRASPASLNPVDSDEMRTPSPEGRRRSSWTCSETEESEFSSAKGTPTPLPFAARTPSSSRSGLGSVLDEPAQKFSPGSPLFPPTPEAVRQAARKARISFMCGPNISPGPFDAAAFGIRNAPPVALMLPIREQRRMSMSSHSSRSPSASPSPSRAPSIGRAESPLEDLFGLPTESKERGLSSLNAAVAAFTFDDEQSVSDQVAVSALLDMNKGDDSEQLVTLDGENNGGVRAFPNPLPSVLEMTAAHLRQNASSSFAHPDSQSPVKPLTTAGSELENGEGRLVGLKHSFRRARSRVDEQVGPPVLSQLPTNVPSVINAGHKLPAKKLDVNHSEKSFLKVAGASPRTGPLAKFGRRASTSTVVGIQQQNTAVSPARNGSLSKISRRASISTPARVQQRPTSTPESDRRSDRSLPARVDPRATSSGVPRGPRRSVLPTGGSSDSRLPRHGGKAGRVTSTIETSPPGNYGSRASASSTEQLVVEGSAPGRLSRGMPPLNEVPPQSAKVFLEALKRVELSRSSAWQTRVGVLTRLQEACQHLGPDTLDVRLALRTFSVLSELTSDTHIKVVPAALDALFSVFLGVENCSSSEAFNPLQAALDRRPEVVQRILLCLVDSRTTTRLAAERVMHSLVAQFRPEVRAMQIVRAMSYMFSADKSRKGVTNIGSPKVMVVGCSHLLAAFRSAEASGEGFVWQPVSLLASILETMAALLRDRRADVRSAAGPVVVAAHSSLPRGAMKLALDALPLSAQDKSALQSVLATSRAHEASGDQESCRSEMSTGGGC